MATMRAIILSLDFCTVFLLFLISLPMFSFYVKWTITLLLH